MHQHERRSHVFDAAGYIGDLAAAGVKVVIYNGALFFYCGEKGGFGTGYSEVQLRYADAMDADPDWIDRVTALAPVNQKGAPL